MLEGFTQRILYEIDGQCIPPKERRFFFMYDLSSCRSIYARMEAFSSNADLENPCNSRAPRMNYPGAWIPTLWQLLHYSRR